MLFNYNKDKGWFVGDTPVGSLFKNTNKELLNQGDNRKFLTDAGQGLKILDDKGIDVLAQRYKDVDEAVIKFAKDQRQLGADGKKLIETFEAQGTALFKFKGVLQGFGHTIKSVLASIGNAVVSMGISLAASLIITGIEKVVNRAKELHEEVQDITNTYTDTTKKLTDNSKEFGELSEKYSELSKGVNSLGQNISLTSSEFEEYHTVTNKIADMVPSLVKGWDDQGNAILRVKDNVEGLSHAYDEEMIKANNAIIKESSKIKKDTKKQFKDFGGQGEFDDMTLLNDILSGSPNLTSKYNLNKIVDTLKKSGVDVDTGMSDLDKLYDFGNDEEYAKAISIYLKNLTTDERNIVAAYVKEHEAIISDGLSSARELLKSEISNNQLQDYKDLDENLKTVVSNIANTISDEELYKLSQGKGGKNGTQDIGQYVQELYSIFDKIPENQVKKINAGIDLTTQWNDNEISYEEYMQKVQEFVKLLEALFPENKDIVETFKILFDIPDEKELAKKQDIFVNRLGEKRVSPNGEMYGVPPEVAEKLKAQGNEVATSWYNSLNKSQREFVDNISDEDLAEAVKFDSTEQFDEWLEKCQNEAEIDVKVKISDSVDSMADMKKAVSSLSDLYDQTVRQIFTAGQATGFADPDLINNVESAFYKFSEELKANGNDAAANEINAALEEFETTLVKFPGDADKAQAAIDRLITKYIDQTDVIKNLTEENAEWSKAQLEAMGITNAEEVVMSRLNKQVKKTQEALNKLRKVLEEYNDALESGDEEAKSQAIDSLVNPTKEALTIRDENGNALKDGSNDFIDNLRPEFIEGHLEDIQAMAEGDVEALNRVRLAAAEDAVMEVTTHVPTEAAEFQIRNLMDLVAQADAMNIEPGASIDDAAFYDHLNQMVRSGQISVEQVNAAFETMGYEAKWKSNPGTFKVPGTAHATSIPGEAAKYLGAKNSIVTWDFKEEKVDFPSLEIITKKGSSGGGAGAHYSPPSSGTGGGGDGNGGGGDNNAAADKNKAQEAAAETFDWIEVYIQRLEEAISRLDKDAGNIYKSWSDRNNSLSSEIQKITEQIKAQDVATQEYARNANLVDATGKVLTKKQSKNVKTADEAWTKDLQEAIIGNKKYTKTTKKDGKTKKSLNKKKLKKDLGDAYNSYIEAAAEELFSIVQYNEKVDKKNKKIKDKNKKKKKKSTTVVVGANKPKKSDYGDDKEQYKADLKAWKEAQKVWKTGDYQKKIREGSMTGDDIESITNKYLIDAIKTETEIVQKAIDATDKKQDLQIELAEKYREQLDKSMKKWEQILELTEKQISIRDKFISRMETAGYWVTDKYYKEQLEFIEQQIEDAEKRRDEAIKLYEDWNKESTDLGGFAKDSEGARQAQLDLHGLNEELEEYKNKKEELKKTRRDLEWEKLDWVIEKLKDSYEEAEALQELLTLDKTMDDYGFFNERGMANLAMFGSQYENLTYRLSKYNEEREHLNDLVKEDPLYINTKEYKERLDEITNAEREVVKEQASLLQNISSAFKESVDQNLANLKEMMEEYKSVLSESKDIYEFSKNIGNQTKNIENLRKQLLAYQTDDSEAARKRRQELTNQLNQAEQQLQETEWDRYISQTGEMLDNLYEVYEENLNEKFDHVTNLLGDVVRETNANGLLIGHGIKDVLDFFGINTTHYWEYLDAEGKRVLSEVTNGKFVKDNSLLLKETEESNKNLKDFLDAADRSDVRQSLFGDSDFLKFDEKSGAVLVKDVTADDNKEKNADANADKKDDSLPYNSNISQSTGIAYLDAQQGIGRPALTTMQLVEDPEVTAARLEKIKSLEEELKTAEADEKRLRKQFTNSKNKDTNALTQANIFHARQLEIKNQLHDLKAPGYAVGSSYIRKNQLAWTQEEGSELIFRRSDGAMLTPLGQGDMVFTNEMTKNLWDLAKARLDVDSNLANLQTIRNNFNNTITNNNTISITLPNVNDYESFKNELQNDTRFEKFIHEITIGQVMGNNTLNKRKY